MTPLEITDRSPSPPARAWAPMLRTAVHYCTGGLGPRGDHFRPDLARCGFSITGATDCATPSRRYDSPATDANAHLDASPGNRQRPSPHRQVESRADTATTTPHRWSCAHPTSQRLELRPLNEANRNLRHHHLIRNRRILRRRRNHPGRTHIHWFHPRRRSTCAGGQHYGFADLARDEAQRVSNAQSPRCSLQRQ